MLAKHSDDDLLRIADAVDREPSKAREAVAAAAFNSATSLPPVIRRKELLYLSAAGGTREKD
jgi:hypothetical protein